MKLSICIQTAEIKTEVPVALLSGSFPQKLRKAADLKYDAVELVVCRPDELDVVQIGRQLRNVNLAVSAVASGAVNMIDGLSLLAPDAEISRLAEERLHELIQFAAEIDASIVTIGSFRGRRKWYSAGDADARLSESLSKAAERARTLGVGLVLEPLNRYESDIINTTTEALSFIEEIGNPNIGILLDSYHVNVEEQSIYSCFVEAYMKGRMWHVHIGDSNRLPPGHGHIDFQGLAHILQKMGYKGFLSAELLPVPDPDRAAEETAHYLQHLMRVIRTTG